MAQGSSSYGGIEPCGGPRWPPRRQKIYAGEPIIDPKLLARGQVPTDGLVPKGLRVVPVPVGPEAIHSGLVLPGSRCDVQVFVKGCPNQGNCGTFCKTILQDIKVFAVNDVTSTESRDPKAPDTISIPGGKTVSLLVTPAQAQIVTVASQLGSIRLILRSADDNEQPKTGVMTAQDLLGAFGGSDRAAEDPNAANEKRFQEWAEKIKEMLRENAKTKPAETPASEEQRFTMRVRTGADVNDVLLINNSNVQGLPGDEGSWTATGLGAIVRNKSNPDTRGPKPDEAGPAAPPAAQAPPKAAANVPIPTSPGSPRSPDGPWTSPVMPQSPGG